MTHWRHKIFFGLFAIAVFAATPHSAAAYCVNNQTGTDLHVRALDAPGFKADIKAGGKTCCDEASCMNRKGKGATVLAVTGYVPVKGAGKPGWKAECRASVSAKGTLTVTGSADKITCKAK